MLNIATLNPLQTHGLSKPKETTIPKLGIDLLAFIQQHKPSVVFTKIGTINDSILYKIKRKDVNTLITYLNKLKLKNFKKPTASLLNKVKKFYGNIEKEYLYLLYDSEGIVLIDNDKIISE